MSKLKNKFAFSEITGALGDLGTTLPIAFALIVINGFPPERIFFLWGIVYILSGWFYKVPISVQPLKAMAVIAIANEYSADMLSSTAFFYGILLIILSSTGAIKWLQKWFSDALVKGIQMGIGLILAKKAVVLVWEKGLILNLSESSLLLNFTIFVTVILAIWVLQFKRKIQIILPLCVIGIIVVLYFGVNQDFSQYLGRVVLFTKPNVSLLLNSFVLLMLPQLPLTLGNAVYAASDSCHILWKEQSERVNPTRLGTSIGLSNVAIGLMGGFPICHGAGGIGAHAQFGGKTGGTTIIIGSILVIIAIIPSASIFLFLIPVPILAALLLFDSLRMVSFVKNLLQTTEMIVAVTVGIIAFATRNLFIALVIGFILEWIIKRKSDS
ncbi:MAG: putative sulfate/molybdate transporter [Candidatus Marinimicrobia bacterium]|nr:hypothetical protein [Candidatus Neomarinimicrobiota bacterium]MBL7023736.1 putative sulfate/molybdate transporter [Candidatus Neomarinimicrobiota bacterium]MBL7109594.1 putative sulfate/molybdate transporter [Candidatus Neomarinimicrobiota bacterium]